MDPIERFFDDVVLRHEILSLLVIFGILLGPALVRRILRLFQPKPPYDPPQILREWLEQQPIGNPNALLEATHNNMENLISALEHIPTPRLPWWKRLWRFLYPNL